MSQSITSAGHITIRIDGKLYCCDSISVDLDVGARVRARIMGLKAKRRTRKKRP